MLFLIYELLLQWFRGWVCMGDGFLPSGQTKRWVHYQYSASTWLYYLSIYLTNYLSTYSSTHLPTYSTYLPTYLPINLHQSIHLLIYLSTYQPTYLSSNLPTYLLRCALYNFRFRRQGPIKLHQRAPENKQCPTWWVREREREREREYIDSVRVYVPQLNPLSCPPPPLPHLISSSWQ